MKFRHALLAIVLMASTAAYAEGPTDPAPGTGSGTGTDFTVLIKKAKYPKPKPNPNRPRVPGIELFLSVSYSNGMLSVEFPEDADSAEVKLNNGIADVLFTGIDRTDNSLELPPLTGDHLLTVSFDNEDVYEGVISF